MRRFVLPFALAAAFVPPLSLAQDEATVASAPWGADDLLALETALRDSVARVRGATVAIRFERGLLGMDMQLGSGVVVSAEGLVLTAAHLFDEPGRDCAIVFEDGTEVEGESLGRNGLQDFAMVRITEQGPWPFAELAQPDALGVLQPLFSLGFPGDDLEQRAPILRVGTLQQEHAGWLQSSCGVMPGDSGGPLFDLTGRVVGIHSWIGLGRDRNYHIPIARFLESWERLAAGEAWQAEEIGVPFTDRMSLVRAPLAPMVGLTLVEDEGCLVTAVRARSAAQEVGLRVGDRIVRVRARAELAGEPGLGRDLRDERAFERWLRTVVARDERFLSLQVERAGEELWVELVAPDPHPLAEAFRPLIARVRGSVITIRSRNKTRALGLVVGSDGWVLTKASELEEGFTCRLPDGSDVAGVVRARDREHDLALLELPVKGLLAASWAPHVDLSVGRLIASVGPEAAPIGVGVVSVAAGALPMRHVGVHGLSLRTATGGGVRLRAVRRGSPAADAGLEKDDVILGVDGSEVADRGDLRAVLERTAGGEVLALRVRRAAEEFEVDLELGAPVVAERRIDNPVAWLSLSDRRDGFPFVLRHDALTEARACGGPLVDRSGRIVGINVARSDRTGCYAIPAQRAAEVLERLFAEARANH